MAVGLLGVAAGPAQAEDFIEHNGDDITYTDDSGEGSTLTVTASRTQIVVSQSGGDTIGEDADECTGDGTSTVTCSPTGDEFDTFETAFFMGDGNDNVTLGGELGVAVLGEDGDDIAVGSDTNGSGELLQGNAGNDQLNARNVGPILAASLSGLDGNGPSPFDVVGDDVHGGDGNDIVASGNGSDFVSGDGDFIILLGVPTRNRTGAGVDGIPEGENPGTDVISSGSGNDEGFAGGGNSDQMNLGEGEDFTVTLGGDGTGDALAGGPGIDQIGFVSTSEEEPVMSGVGAACRLTISASTSLRGDDQHEHRVVVDQRVGTAVEFEDAFTDPGTTRSRERLLERDQRRPRHRQHQPR